MGLVFIMQRNLDSQENNLKVLKYQKLNIFSFLSILKM